MKIKKCKFFTLLLSAALLLQNAPVLSVAAAPSGSGAAASTDADDSGADENTDGGAEDGAAETVILSEDEMEEISIASTEDFLAFAENCHLDSWSSGKIVRLEADIDLSGTDFTMIPIFAGIFDGGGHTISGYRPEQQGYIIGLFRYVQAQGVIRNLSLKGNISASDEKECVGSFCGVNRGTIKNCDFQGTVSGQNTVGGITGINEASGTISACSVSGRVIGYYDTGGVAGINHGVITFCGNHAGVNDNSAWVEEDDEMGTGIFFSIQATDDEVEIYSGVDTGGIAGYSDGLIERCANDGTVGYEHTGYNIGGIAGRQTGVVLLSTNSGSVYGRKDVGGIIGQMEPDIEVDEGQSLRNAVDKLHDLIDKTLVDMQAGKNAMKADLDSLSSFGDGVLDSGNLMADQLTGFVDGNVTQVQSVTARMEHIIDLLPGVMDQTSAAGNSLTRLSDTFDRFVADLDVDLGEDAQKEIDNVYNSIDELRQQSDYVRGCLDRINAIRDKGDGTQKKWEELGADDQQKIMDEVVNMSEPLARMSSSASSVLSELSTLAQISAPYIQDSAESSLKDLSDATGLAQGMVDSIHGAHDNSRGIIDYMNAQPDVQLTTLGTEFDANRENLHAQLMGVSDSLKRLTGDTSQYSDLVNEDLRAVNDQLNVVFQLLADHLTDETDMNLDQLYEEVDEEEIDSILTGKCDSCINNGVIKGDINIGGIAGAMSIDEEDPEDNAAGNISYQPGQRFITKCIITDGINNGYITAKKDGAGGIVGYMKHGIVSGSEGYGNVESTEGDYVGGIAGQSLTAILDSYALCSVSGGKDVGGIAGYGNTLRNCYAIVSADASIGKVGAVAGQIADDADVTGNYYVGSDIFGIDDISYAGMAEPISYEELLTVEQLPTAFWHLKVTYRIEDTYLGTQEVAYGESLATLDYPQIPAKDGYYGAWPDYSDRIMTGNLLIDGSYVDTVTVVQSTQTEDTDSAAAPVWQKPYALVEQTFTEDTVLNATLSDLTPPDNVSEKDQYVIYDITLENGGISPTDTFAVRLLNPYGDKAAVWGYLDGRWSLLDSKVRGQYLQVDMTGDNESFCIVQNRSYLPYLIAAAAAAAVILLLAILLIKHRKKKRGSR